MQNGPVTKYWRREVLDEDVDALEALGFRIRRLDCAAWTNEKKMHKALRDVFEVQVEDTGVVSFPTTTGRTGMLSATA